MLKGILLVTCLLCALFLSAQHRSTDIIEKEIELLELQIQEQERIIAKNDANGQSADNKQIRSKITIYELEIEHLLKELQGLPVPDKNELAFMKMQQKVRDLEEKVEDYEYENKRLFKEKEDLADDNAWLRDKLKVEKQRGMPRSYKRPSRAKRWFRRVGRNISMFWRNLFH